MSTNIPFTLVEGAVALPPLRPLGPLSRTHGREWALLPPNVSLRIELKALYAAMLRTFCLSSQAIRSMCSWEPIAAQVEAGSVAAVVPKSAGALSQHDGAAFAVQASSQTVGTASPSAKASGATAGVRPIAHAPHRTSNRKLGSAVAIGGAAMLAWIVLDHPHREHANDAAPTANVPASTRVVQQAEPSKAVAVAVASGNQTTDAKSDSKSSANLDTSTEGAARVAQIATVSNPESLAAAPATRTSTAPVGANPIASASRSRTVEPALAQAARPASSTPAVANSARADTQNVATNAVSAVRPAPAPTSAAVAAKPLEIASRDGAPVTARRSGTAISTATSITAPPSWTARHAASSAESAVSRSASTNAKPSAAGEYSPFAPSARVDREYESVTTSARTYSTYSAHGTSTANTVTPQRAQDAQRSNADANDPSWMGRMSQRRVTEVPELFSR
jgi:hypothetical protein